MAIYNITTKTESNILSSNIETGNNRSDILVKPRFGVADYTSCVIGLESITGNDFNLRSCRMPTEAWHGTQPNPDVMIENFIVEKYE